jgi:hypothetical protein
MVEAAGPDMKNPKALFLLAHNDVEWLLRECFLV